MPTYAHSYTHVPLYTQLWLTRLLVFSYLNSLIIYFPSLIWDKILNIVEVVFMVLIIQLKCASRLLQIRLSIIISLISLDVISVGHKTHSSCRIIHIVYAVQCINVHRTMNQSHTHTEQMHHTEECRLEHFCSIHALMTFFSVSHPGQHQVAKSLLSKNPLFGVLSCLSLCERERKCKGKCEREICSEHMVQQGDLRAFNVVLLCAISRISTLLIAMQNAINYHSP